MGLTPFTIANITAKYNEELTDFNNTVKAPPVASSGMTSAWRPTPTTSTSVILPGKAQEIIPEIVPLYISDLNFASIVTTLKADYPLKSKTLEEFNYTHDIVNQDDAMKNNLFRWRARVFYQFLIFLHNALNNEDAFRQIYSANATTYERPFQQISVEDLATYKLGLFGSTKATSDIDLGIQYSGLKPGFCFLAHVVTVFEDLFPIFLKKSSLDLDIETYGDLVTIPDPNDMNSAGIYFISTHEFGEKEFKEVLPYLGASIYRNNLHALKDTNQNPQPLEENNTTVMDALIKYVIKNLNEPALLAGLGAHVDYDNFRDYMNDILVTALNENEWIKQAIQKVNEYYFQTYDEKRNLYYQYLRVAEETVAKYRDEIIRTGENTMTNEQTLECMKVLGDALVCREEDYVCTPTILHVVRIIQPLQGEKKKMLAAKAEVDRAEAVTDSKIASLSLSMPQSVTQKRTTRQQNKTNVRAQLIESFMNALEKAGKMEESAALQVLVDKEMTTKRILFTLDYAYKEKKSLRDEQKCLPVKYVTNAQCSLGPFGYIISLIEQAGFLVRFKETYCDDHALVRSKKCTDKEEKYGRERFWEAVLTLLNAPEIIINKPVLDLEHCADPEFPYACKNKKKCFPTNNFSCIKEGLTRRMKSLSIVSRLQTKTKTKTSMAGTGGTRETMKKQRTQKRPQKRTQKRTQKRIKLPRRNKKTRTHIHKVKPRKTRKKY
jgi:hypothetical protein